ncbi:MULTISPECIES: DUF6212 domain-containing protein [Roseomonadaceae]|uniref:Uncharacterized protein n=1 Tax=Falsiroseomonas oleicola TaxID=2801474 RepID=A0ABS6HF74_9PROT|nr:DUF6212 domain-containing protein [Roseomonas oleicola]MBU8547049.1 hypothetical protein [Roseomonas oleicola]
MTAFLIDDAARGSLAAGHPTVVAAPGMTGLEALPLAVLRPDNGVLRLDGAAPGAAVPLPPGLRPLAILAPDGDAAAPLVAGLPFGIPPLIGHDPMPGLMALLVQTMADLRAERLALLGAPGSRPPAARRMLIDLPPVPQEASLPQRIAQHFGRPAEGLASIALHVAAARATAASQLRVRLLAAGRVLAAWVVPGDEVQGGWLALDLPRPAPPGPAEAVLDVAVETASGETLVLSAGGLGATAPLALRAEVAELHHLVLPRHFDWAACDLHALVPGVAMPLAPQAMQAASLSGASQRMVAAGSEAPRMMLDIEPGATATLQPPSLSPGAADLALAELTCRLGDPSSLRASLQAGPEGGAGRDSGWRLADPNGALRISLPLPADLGGGLWLTLVLRNTGTAPLAVEVSTLALMAGAAGVPRRPPPGLGASAFAAATQPLRLAVPLPGDAPPAPIEAAPLAIGLPGPAPNPPAAPPPLLGGEAGAPLPPPAPAAVMPMAPPVAVPVVAGEMAPGGADFQDIKLHQHTTNTDGSYQHIDLSLTGLVAPAGVWREARLKLFDRRGTVGLEFRRIKGWPAMFEAWPHGGSDQYGPFWRVETQGTAEAMSKLTSAQDRAMLAALMELLPGLARHAARVAGLPPEEHDNWAERGRIMSAAVDATRGAPQRPSVGPG